MKYLWLDLEMTGLNVEKCRIIEAAALVTDNKWQTLPNEFHCVIKQPKPVMDEMDEWCQTTHKESGLLDAIKKNGISEKQAEKELVHYLETQFGNAEGIILCGNSIGQDRKFIDRYWPTVSHKLHYRMLDVTGLKIAFSTLGIPTFTKKNYHRAIDDIRESIAELQYYLSFVQVNSSISIEEKSDSGDSNTNIDM